MPAGRFPILTIAPSFLLSALLSAYRGYFQGLQQMEPTAWSQLIEEIAKFAIGYLLARLWLGNGSVWAAVGALLGIPLSEVLALLFLRHTYTQALPELRRQIRQSAHAHQPLATGSEVAHDLWKQALPITLGAVVLPLVTLVDNVMVVNVLKSIGFSQQMAEIRFGILDVYKRQRKGRGRACASSRHIMTTAAIQGVRKSWCRTRRMVPIRPQRM